VERGDNETTGALISRFIQLTKKSGIIREMRDRERFITNGEKRRRAHAAAIRRARSATTGSTERF
jgi:ribosomal protein S21